MMTTKPACVLLLLLAALAPAVLASRPRADVFHGGLSPRPNVDSGGGVSSTAPTNWHPVDGTVVGSGDAAVRPTSELQKRLGVPFFQDVVKKVVDAVKAIGPPSPLPRALREFTASLQITRTDVPADHIERVLHVEMYSKLEFDGTDTNDFKFKKWHLTAEVRYGQTRRRTIFRNGWVVDGRVEASGNFNETSCKNLDVAQWLDLETRSFIPQALPDAEQQTKQPSSADAKCTQQNMCRHERAVIGGEVIIGKFVRGKPVQATSRYLNIKVLKFNPGGDKTKLAITPTLGSCERLAKSQGKPVPAGFNKLRKVMQAKQMVASMKPDASADQHRAPVASVASANPDAPNVIAADNGNGNGNGAPAADGASSGAGVSGSSGSSNGGVPPKRLASHNGAGVAAPTLVETEAEQCSANDRGDGYCDRKCNNAENNWDNGDCCPGTCISSRYACGYGGYECKKSDLATKPCLFLHGLGLKGPNSFSNQLPPGAREFGVKYYWADFAKELAGVCTSIIYNHHNTVDFGWQHKPLQDSYYAKALEVFNAGGVVFAHSMGNVILGGACLEQNKCSVRWYNVGGPTRGSNAANLQQSVPFIGNKAGKSLTHSYKGMMAAPAPWTDAISRTIAQKKLLKGLNCGISGYGSGGVVGAALSAAKWGAYCDFSIFRDCEHDVQADGLVGIEECARYTYVNKADNKRYWWHLSDGRGLTRRWWDTNFLYNGNHQDQTGSRGNHNGILNWYRAMARRG